jgi:hypothetical protein
MNTCSPHVVPFSRECSEAASYQHLLVRAGVYKQAHVLLQHTRTHAHAAVADSTFSKAGTRARAHTRARTHTESTRASTMALHTRASASLRGLLAPQASLSATADGGASWSPPTLYLPYGRHKALVNRQLPSGRRVALFECQPPCLPALHPLRLAASAAPPDAWLVNHSYPAGRPGPSGRPGPGEVVATVTLWRSLWRQPHTGAECARARGGGQARAGGDSDDGGRGASACPSTSSSPASSSPPPPLLPVPLVFCPDRSGGRGRKHGTDDASEPPAAAGADSYQCSGMLPWRFGGRGDRGRREPDSDDGPAGRLECRADGAGGIEISVATGGALYGGREAGKVWGGEESQKGGEEGGAAEARVEEVEAFGDAGRGLLWVTAVWVQVLPSPTAPLPIHPFLSAAASVCPLASLEAQLTPSPSVVILMPRPQFISLPCIPSLSLSLARSLSHRDMSHTHESSSMPIVTQPDGRKLLYLVSESNTAAHWQV